VLEKEIEREGIPCVLITTLIPTAKMIGANRVIQGIAITNPLGNPEVSQREEKDLRKKIVNLACKLLTEYIESEKEGVLDN
jgi:glycine reductase